jgi:NAD(P)-dependent dehydrogenase (short-subunit alcohol dehydrogenase family)
LKQTKARVEDVNSQTQCSYSVCDNTVASQVAASVKECVKLYGGIDAVDANAGYLDPWAKIGESDPATWWRNWEVNVKGTYHVIRFTLTHLSRSAKKCEASGTSGGHLILVSSVGAQLLTPGGSGYQTSKHAINRLCEFVQVDHGEEGIKCFSIHPGGVSTELGRNMPEESHQYLVDSPEWAAGFKVWLCSGRADWAKGTLPKRKLGYRGAYRDQG